MTNKETNWIRGTVVVPAESSSGLMGVMTTEAGQTLYFSEWSYRVNLKDIKYSGDPIKSGDQVVVKARLLGTSVWRPVEFYKD